MTTTDTVPVTQTIADAQATLRVLEEKGWGQGAWCLQWSLDGTPLRQFCLGGAMTYAIRPDSQASPNFLYGEERARFEALALAMNLPTRKVEDYVVDWVVKYNDEVAEAVEDVKARLTEAIDRLEAQLP